MDSEEFDKLTGPICPICNKETFRMIEGKCFSCYQATVVEKELIAEDKTMKRIYSRKMREGTISLEEMRQGHL